MTQVMQFLKEAVKVINENATIILVIITGVYSYFTYKMAKIMAKQVISDIQISNVILGSNFAENWFKEKIKKEPELIKNFSFRSVLLFDVRNKSSGNGSIDKPTLVLKFLANNVEYEVSPTTKDIEWENTGANTSKQIITDLGGTIFLRGGDYLKIELEYSLYDFEESMFKNLKENITSLEYYIKFNDNLGKCHLIKIIDIRGEGEVYRK